jgi:hypothetical protein
LCSRAAEADECLAHGPEFLDSINREAYRKIPAKAKKFMGGNKKGADPHTVPGARRSGRSNVRAGMAEMVGFGTSKR